MRIEGTGTPSCLLDLAQMLCAGSPTDHVKGGVADAAVRLRQAADSWLTWGLSCSLRDSSNRKMLLRPAQQWLLCKDVIQTAVQGRLVPGEPKGSVRASHR